MKKKALIVGLILAAIVGGGLYYRTHFTKGGADQAEHKEEPAGGNDEHKDEKGGHEGHAEHGEEGKVKMSAEVQKQNGVALAPVTKQRMAGMISATGKVEANADKIAHVSPRISGKVVSVKASLGDSVTAGQSPGDPGQRRAW